MKTIADFENTFARQYRNWFLQKIQLCTPNQALTATLENHPQLLCIMNHGGFLGPWAAALGFHYLYHQYGGQHRKPTGIAWRGFYKLPIYRQITQFLTQTNQPLDFEQCQALLTEKTFNDMIILPEGTNCHYFNGSELQPFISHRFVELSRATQVPMLLMVHCGSEHWNIRISVPNLLLPITRFLPKRYRQGLDNNKLVNVPHMLKGRIPSLKIACSVYHSRPDCHSSEEEALIIRNIMQEMYNQLRQDVTNQNAFLAHPCAEQRVPMT
ncbi:hypothetical protein [Litoribacillus peritrichatus]|uniref:Phospholipid/glycerol acyltransferase domain-containing protein n=1 Tax=Litoribacillus peritrichatus TaxID=718191 RepID=A0ABP7N872_9GAMM